MAWHEHKPWRWFKFDIDPKTSITALAAFVISIISLIIQGILLISRPDILQFPPEQILFHPDETAANYLNVAGRVSYLNRGRGDKSAVLKLERILFRLGGKNYELKWQTFEKYYSEGTALKTRESLPSEPAVIKSGEANTHETNFAPRSLRTNTPDDPARYQNFITWDRFISEVSKLKTLEFRIVSEFYGLDTKEMVVGIDVTRVLLDNLKANKWAAPSCWLVTDQKSQANGSPALPTATASPEATTTKNNSSAVHSPSPP